MKEGTPSKNPADRGSLAGVVSSILDKRLQNTDNCLPAKVISYDRDKNVATVQPLIAVLTTMGGTVSRALVASVPVLALGGGGYVLNFPLKKGDLGWIEASDRDISLFMQSMKEARPNTLRKHSFEDAKFVPDIFRQYSIQGEDAGNMVIQTLDGSVRLAIWPDRVKTTAGETWAEVNADGSITATAPEKLTADVGEFSLIAALQAAIEAGAVKLVLPAAGASSLTDPSSIALNAPLVTVGGVLQAGALAIAAPAGSPPSSSTIKGTLEITEGDIIINGTSLSAFIAFMNRHVHNAPVGGGNTGGPL